MKPSEIVEKLVEHLQDRIDLGNFPPAEVQYIITEWLLDNNISIKENLKEAE